MTASQAASASPPSILAYFKDFKVLKETPREYWGIQLINFIDSAAYFSLLTIVTIFLSEEVHLNDTDAGYVVTLLTSLITIFLLFSGFLTDSLGIIRSLWLSLGSRLVLTGAVVLLAKAGDFQGRTFLISAALVLMAPALAMVQTAFQSAIKRYTNVRSRSAGFNLWYLFMNVGAAGSGIMIDVMRLHFGLSTVWVIGSGLATSLLCMVALLFLVKREEQYGEDNQFSSYSSLPQATADQGSSFWSRPYLILKAMVSEKAFWKFVALITLLLGVRAVFTYIYLLMPKYWLRILGPDAAIGTLNAINPVLIIIGLILFIPLTNKFNIFKMLVYGAMVSALSLFALALPWQQAAAVLSSVSSYLPASWLTDPFVAAYYALSVLSMILLSIGEVIWSPKLQEYTAAIAPEGQEGSYLGLSMLPWFLAKTVVSVLSGHMLTRWVPEGIGTRLRQGEVSFWDSPEAMWLILGIVALLGPIIALIFKNWFTKGARWQR